MTTTRTDRSGRAWLVILLLLAAAAAALYFTGLGDRLFGEDEQPLAGRAVQRGPLRISVVERANILPAKSVTLRSEVEGRTTILYLVEEGTWVEPGTLVCELDTAALLEERVSQEISVQNAEAEFVKAKQNYEIQVSQNTSDIARAERELAFAKLDLQKYLEGDHPQEEQRRAEEILLADEELTRAEQDLGWSEQLAEAGFLENTQLEADRLAAKRAEITLNQKTRALELLKEYEHPRQLQELEANVEEMGRELDRVRLQAQARLVDYEADRRTSKARLDLEMEKLSRIDSQVQKARMFAPIAGMVVYFQEDGGWRGDDDPIQEGREVREREEIITIPSAEGMIAEATLHESVLEKVQVGMPCLITVDAVPDRSFHGRVRTKAALPDKNTWFSPDLRVYRTVVDLLETDPRLHAGMSASIEIVVEDLEDVHYVPLQSIFLDQGKTVCFVSEAGIEKREVVVGENDGKWVVIESGLEEGEIVLLSQPPGFGLKPAVEERKASPPVPFEALEGFGGPGNGGGEGAGLDGAAGLLDGERGGPGGPGADGRFPREGRGGRPGMREREEDGASADGTGGGAGAGDERTAESNGEGGLAPAGPGGGERSGEGGAGDGELGGEPGALPADGPRAGGESAGAQKAQERR